MKRLSLLVGLLLTSMLTLAESAEARLDKEMPTDFRLKGLEGGHLRASDLKGKRVVLQFFASWCEGCGEVMGELRPLVADAEGVRFVPISVDEHLADAKDYFRHQKAGIKPLEKRAYLDVNTKLATALNVKALPAIVVIDEAGHILSQTSGHPDKKQLGKIKSLLLAH